MDQNIKIAAIRQVMAMAPMSLNESISMALGSYNFAFMKSVKISDLGMKVRDITQEDVENSHTLIYELYTDVPSSISWELRSTVVLDRNRLYLKYETKSNGRKYSGIVDHVEVIKCDPSLKPQQFGAKYAPKVKKKLEEIAQGLRS